MIVAAVGVLRWKLAISPTPVPMVPIARASAVAGECLADQPCGGRGNHDEARDQDDADRLDRNDNHDRGLDEQQVPEHADRHAGDRGELGVEDRIGEARPERERHREAEHGDDDHHLEHAGRDHEHVAKQQALDVDLAIVR